MFVSYFCYRTLVSGNVVILLYIIAFTTIYWMIGVFNYS